ncbi:MAG: M56 family metallopeptidase [Pseudomonadota bacterium]
MIGSVSEGLAYVGQTTLAVSLLIGLVLLVRRPFAKHFGAKAAYALWMIPAVRLVLPPLPDGWSLFGPLSRTTAEAPAVETWSSGTTLVGEMQLSAPSAPVTEVIPLVPLEAAPVPGTPPMSLYWLADLSSSVAPGMALLTIWMIGAAGFFTWSACRQALFSRIVSAETQNASPAVLTEAMEICQSIGLDHRKVSIQTSFISDSPFVTGLFRPIIVLPAWFELDYSPEEREVALMHELMHVKRRDLWALQASTLFLALQWFNPAAHYAMRAFRSDQEASCDADVIGFGCSTPHTYGATLVKAVRKTRPAATPAMATSLSLTHSLAERLKQLRNPLPTVRRRMMGSALSATIGSVALIASACTTASAHPHEFGDELDGAPPQPPAPEQALRPDTPPKPKKHHVIINHSGHGSRIVLLDNPMDDVERDIDAVAEISSLIELEASEMEALIDENVSQITTDIAIAMADVAREFVIETEDGGMSLRLSGSDERATSDIMAFVGKVSEMAANGEINELELDALTDEFEDRIDDWADSLEARVEAMEPIWEARVGAYANSWTDKIEARIEAHAEAIERHSDVIESHSDRIEEAGDLIGDLADDCTDEAGLRVVSRISNENGKRYKAVCLDLAGGMTKDEIMDRLRASGELNDAELNAFCEKFDEADAFTVKWNFTDD